MSNPIILYDNALRYGNGNQPVPSFQALFNDNETIDYGTGPITSTRSSVGYYFDPTTKLLTSAAVDELRFERDPVDGVVRALVEESRTNLALYSEQFDNAAWIKSSCTTTADATTAPDGNVTADEIVASAATAFVRQTVTVTAATQLTVSCFVKSSSSAADSRLQVSVTSGNAQQYFDVTTGTLGAAAGTIAVDHADIVDVGSGWYRVSMTLTTSAGDTAASFVVVSSAATTANLYVWGAQLEEATRMSSYIPTTTVAVTRSADVVSIPNTEIPALPNGVTIEGVTTLPNDGAVHDVFNATGTGATYLRRATSGVLEGQLGAVSFTTATTPDELPHLYGLKTDGTNHYVLVDGVSVYTFTGSLTQPTGTLYIGSNSGSSEHVNNLLGGLRIWSSFLTEAELTANSSGYAISTGLEQSGTLLTEAWTWDALRNAILTADVNGAATVNLYIRGAAPTHFVFGAHRHDAAGFRVNEGTCYIDAYTASGWTNVGSANLATNASNLPELIVLSAYTPDTIAGHYQFRMRLTGLTASSDFAIPELFLGEALTMPFIEYGFDPATEEWTGPSTTAETGRIYESALSRRYTSNPSFTYIDGATATAIDTFRESHLEERTPFWWFWEPTGSPTVGYMMKHAAKSAPMPIVNAIYRRLQLQMIEAV